MLNIAFGDDKMIKRCCNSALCNAVGDK